jgi:Prealbumin-like fold domain
MRRTAMAVVTLLTVGLLYPVVAAAPALAADPQNVQITLEGCKLGTLDLTTVTCDDGDYTSGNLGKNWNELDLVPYRLTLDPGQNAPANQTYTITIVLDAVDGNPDRPGYDVISSPVVGTGSCTVTDTGQLTTSGFGGIEQSIYRELTITQGSGTCVLDYYGRLAVGSHLFPGSSLHANVADEDLDTGGIGARDVSIPVKEILPQSLSKTMTATQDADHTWVLQKTVSPVDINFGNICDTPGPQQADVDVTVTWTRNAAVPSGQVAVTTVVTATNPAHREIRVKVSDDIRSGTNVLNSLTNGAGVVVPANTSAPVLTHTINIPAAEAVNLNDIATATYLDELTQVPVPGQTTATATATVQPGNVTNASATITDTESITGTGLQFSVAAPSVGSFTNGYLAGSQTSGPVNWSSGVQNGSGSVTFDKTVHFDGSGSTTGQLSDTATLTTSGNVTQTVGPVSVTISATKAATLTINKTTSVPVDADTTFEFTVTGPGGPFVVPLTILQGGTSGSATLGGLSDGTYTLDETVTGGFADPANQQVTFGAADCAKSVLFNNTFAPAKAKVVKQTIPDTIQDKSGFEFTLYLDDDGTPGAGDPNNDTAIDTDTTDANGNLDFGELTAEGNYYILETDVPDGFIDGGPVSGCTFTVNYPADKGKTFTCTWTNTKLAQADVEKVTDPAGNGNEAGFEFKLYLDNTAPAGPNDPNTDTLIATKTSVNGDPLNFGVSLAAGNYYVLETAKTGWESNGGVGCTFTVVYPADAGKTFHCVFTNTARGSISVVKSLSGGTSTDTFPFEVRTGVDISTDPDTPGTVVPGTQVNVTADGNVVLLADNLLPGVYSVCETVMPGWTTNLPNQYTLVIGLSNERICTDVTITIANQDVTLTVDNTPPPGGEQRTIGFWKNWSSCGKSSGKQEPVLDETLASFPIASGQTTHGLFVGDLYVDTCNEAVRILSKESLSGAKKASDPLFNMAAQLLGAQLNVQAGAGTCPAATNAITQGQALLVKYHWNGNTYSPALSKADKTLGNQLNGTLDQYNNGNLC